MSVDKSASSSLPSPSTTKRSESENDQEEFFYGEEGEEGEEDEEYAYENEELSLVEEEHEEIEEIVYNADEYISKPYLSPRCTIPEGILKFNYSYGYDCHKLFNICVPQNDLIIYSSGSLIHFYNVLTGEKTFRRCYTGGGVGHIAVSPVTSFFCFPIFRLICIFFCCIVYIPEKSCVSSLSGRGKGCKSLYNNLRMAIFRNSDRTFRWY